MSPFSANLPASMQISIGNSLRNALSPVQVNEIRSIRAFVHRKNARGIYAGVNNLLAGSATIGRGGALVPFHYFFRARSPIPTNRRMASV
jgi:hypothetical protein